MRQTLPLLQKKLKTQESANTLSFLEKFGQAQRKVKNGVLGRVVHRRLDEDELEATEEARFQVAGPILPVFPRYRKEVLVFWHAILETALFVKCVCSEVAHIQKKSISKFCFKSGVLVAIVSVFQLSGEDTISTPRSFIPDHKAAKRFNSFAYKVKKISF